jgi:hypothetical protein
MEAVVALQVIRIDTDRGIGDPDATTRRTLEEKILALKSEHAILNFPTPSRQSVAVANWAPRNAIVVSVRACAD